MTSISRNGPDSRWAGRTVGHAVTWHTETWILRGGFDACAFKTRGFEPLLVPDAGIAVCPVQRAGARGESSAAGRVHRGGREDRVPGSLGRRMSGAGF